MIHICAKCLRFKLVLTCEENYVEARAVLS